MAERTQGSALSIWIFLGFSLLAAGAVLVGLKVFVGVDLDAPTLALAAACALMIWALRGMWGVLTALSRSNVELLVEQQAEASAHQSSRAELREEKLRVLRAIKELEFDHDMGKLSDEDFEDVMSRYKLRAIEVMRALDEGEELHPLLADHLRLLGEGARS
ncbi:hypothetical protein G6O69_01625 [Pseudenhygromyxa sp. WMMC2535]|uniref:hypothetical protein n=1 Tax=Pseudenhygromyxa sp. WMMC2535 TaxID=2712867 RepID=UPI001555AE8F|nr:hypothetical protein [Pseudenhygromyxa sp. WMMC2535]NVB36513.1 hypothetical protein [Pseudenhygromyxa sp. WMMC2535]